MRNGGGSHSAHGNHHGSGSEEKPDCYVKKPPNAFMLYMKEQREKVVAEGTLKESAAVNQILGKRWKSLGDKEKQVYFDKASEAKKLHMEKYPGWSCRENYRKRRKRVRAKAPKQTPKKISKKAPKKCRAIHGWESQELWCAGCRFVLKMFLLLLL